MSATTQTPTAASPRARRPAALAVLCLALLAGCNGDDQASEPANPQPPAQTADCPPRPVLAQPRAPEAQLRRAREGVFDVYGFRTRLEPPIDWAMNPHGSLRFQAYLSNWTFLEPLLAGYRSTGDADYLRQAAEIATDWIDSNPRSDPAGGVGTWSGKVAGDRAPRLAYLLAAGGCRGVLSATTNEELQASLREHLAILQGPESSGETNHGSTCSSAWPRSRPSSRSFRRRRSFGKGQSAASDRCWKGASPTASGWSTRPATSSWPSGWSIASSS